MSEKYYYRCNDCGAEYPSGDVIYLCPACRSKNKPGMPPKGVLKTLFDYDAIRNFVSAEILFGYLRNRGYLDLLPLQSLESLPPLRIGNTPLYRFEAFTGGQAVKRIKGRVPELLSDMDFDLYLKDDSQNPTFSFKDRASALVSAWAKEHHIGTIIAASTGNAGCSLAGICASQGQHSMIFVPANAPPAKLTQIVMYGAIIIPVRGTYDDAFDLSVKATELSGLYNRNTAYNPLTIEGKKSVSFELFDQLHQEIPDRIFVPVGDGVVLSGVYKGFEDLLKLGIISRMPVVVAVQSDGSPNVINNIGTEKFTSTPSRTIADSISVDVPRNFYMTVGYLKEYAGEWITVSDPEIVQASALLARSTGIFSEPAAVAAFAGMLKYHATQKIPAGTKNVVLLTGSGLKDLSSVRSVMKLPEPVDPDPKALEKVLKRYLDT